MSSSHHKAGTIDFDDLQSESHYKAAEAYCQSKLANVLFTHELAPRLNGCGVTANCLHRGATRTNFGLGLGGAWSILLKAARPFFRGPAKGARTPLFLASSPDVADISGRYFVNMATVEPSLESLYRSAAERLWRVSAELTGVSLSDPDETALS